jgi:predicted transcriptional regulator
VAILKERLEVNKQRSHRFNMQMFKFKRLKEAEGIEQYHVYFSDRFAVLEDLEAEVDINSAWETFREIIKVSTEDRQGYHEWK